MSTIIDILSREILDSRGNPTVEVECITESGAFGRAQIPSGASTGIHEAIELRDGDEKRYGGKGVLKAVEIVNDIISPEIVGEDALFQSQIDRILIELDGTENKSKLGANAILGVSLAVAKAAANFLDIPLYRYIGGSETTILPYPQCNVINGGKHADNNLDIQEFLIIPVGAPSFKEGIRYAAETFHTLKNILKSKNLFTGVGDEGGFAPMLNSNEEAFKLIVQAIEKAGYKPGKDIIIGIDPAASNFYRDEKYIFEGEQMSARDIINIYKEWIKKYPLLSIEDGLAEDDWKNWTLLEKELGDEIQIVGDDIYVTNIKRIKRGIEENTSNAVLIKLNQIGTLSETIDAIEFTHRAGWRTVVSHRSGETVDVTIAHLAVGKSTGQIKTGSLSRSERIEKYNELIRIEEELGETAQYGIEEIFKKG